MKVISAVAETIKHLPRALWEAFLDTHRENAFLYGDNFDKWYWLNRILYSTTRDPRDESFIKIQQSFPEPIQRYITEFMQSTNGPIYATAFQIHPKDLQTFKPLIESGSVELHPQESLHGLQLKADIINQKLGLPVSGLQLYDLDLGIIDCHPTELPSATLFMVIRPEASSLIESSHPQ